MNIAVIFAGGVGKRMHTKEKTKQFLEIYNKPIIVHTLEKFEKHKDIDGIVIVCVENWISYMNDLVYKYRLEKVKKIVPGGETGQLSIYHGLCAAKEISGDEKSIVLIHDGVRPLIDKKLQTQRKLIMFQAEQIRAWQKHLKVFGLMISCMRIRML